MKINVCEQYRKGKKLKKKVILENIDLNLMKGESTIFSDMGNGVMATYPLIVSDIQISADGILLKGVQESNFETWTRQEWWCTPIKSKST